jgi:hypothetical protein
MIKINSKDFRVRPGKAVHLDKWPTIVKPFEASSRYAPLLIFQGMEAGARMAPYGRSCPGSIRIPPIF